MGGSCCKTSSDFTEIKFNKSVTNRIRYINNNIKIHITSGCGYPISIDAHPNLSFKEIKKQYCKIIGKKTSNKLVFVYKGKVIEENESLKSLGIQDEITIVAFDGNDYNTWYWYTW